MSFTKNQWIAIAAVVATALLFALLLYVASPQRAMASIHTQIEEGNGLGQQMPLRQRDLQALFLQRTQTQMRQDIAQGKSDSKFLVLGPAMAEIIAERVAWEMSDPKVFKRQLVDSQGRSVFREAEGGYRGVFRYTVSPLDSEIPTLVLKRKGLGWTIESLEFSGQ